MMMFGCQIVDDYCLDNIFDALTYDFHLKSAL